MVMKIRIYIVILLLSVVLLWSCEPRTNSYNSGGNSVAAEDEIVEVEEEYEDDCDYCDGIGRNITTCSSCGGTGATYHLTSGTRPKSCNHCMGTGVVRCETCGGYGYTRCDYCNGNGSFRCTVCKGYGIIIIDPSRPHLSPQCNNCSGTGYEKCTICRGEGRIKCCNNGLAKCPVCWGSGTYGSENYSNYHTENCSNCSGSGSISNWCYECNGMGRVIKTRIVQKKKSEL